MRRGVAAPFPRYTPPQPSGSFTIMETLVVETHPAALEISGLAVN